MHPSHPARRILSLVCIFLAAILSLWLLLTAAAAIPNDAIRANMKKSALYYADREPFAFSQSGRWNAIADNYADAILLGVAWNMGTEPPFSGALNTRYNDGGELGENAGLLLAVTEGEPANTDYTRYWHGMAALIRPLLLLTDVAGIKLLGFFAILALTAANAAILIRRRHVALAVFFVLSLAAVHVWNARLAMEYQPGFLVMLAMLPFWLTLERRGDRFLERLAVIAGVSIAFFDFLTTETLTILFPLLLIIAVRTYEGRLGSTKALLAKIVRCGGAWISAYACTFLVKWLAASLVTGENLFTLALAGAAERFGGAVSGNVEAPRSFFSPITANFTMIFTAADRVEYNNTLLCLTGAVLAILSVWYLLRTPTGRRDPALILLALGMLVPLRYLVLNNHSFLHAFFTYRALASTMFAVWTAVWMNVRLRGVKPKGKMKEKRHK